MTIRAAVAAVALAPVAFWALATAVAIVGHQPDALETPLLWVVVTWVLFVPVFAVAGVLPIATARYLESLMPSWLGALSTGCMAAAITVAITLSNEAALLCGFVAAFLGARLAGLQQRGAEEHTDGQAPTPF